MISEMSLEIQAAAEKLAIIKTTPFTPWCKILFEKLIVT
jgi:hypothetical protein